MLLSRMFVETVLDEIKLTRALRSLLHAEDDHATMHGEDEAGEFTGRVHVRENPATQQQYDASKVWWTS